MAGAWVTSGLSVHVKSDVLDRSMFGDLSAECARATDLDAPHFDYYREERVVKARILMRKFLAGYLDMMPLGCPEKDVLERIALVTEESDRAIMRWALKILDPGCFEPEMDIPGAEIRLAESTLRRSTLLVFKALLDDHFDK